jgi:nucleotide-binding universal stress UspA family protein
MSSYLLPIDGSQESRSAAYFAWELAGRTGASVTAQHVIDSARLWRFLAHDHAGFVGSGLYFEAREKILNVLHSVGESLMMAYNTQMAGQNLSGASVIDEGDPATEVARRAADHDLVILGFHSGTRAPERLRMFEKLASTCPCPILVVRDTSHPWSKIQMLLTSDIADAENIARLYQISSMMALPTEVFADNEVSPAALELCSMGGWSRALGVHSIKRGEFTKLVEGAAADALLVVSGQSLVGHARFRARMKAFLEGADHRAMLIWRNTPAAEQIAS